jgi:FkbM family methyltransferase
MIRSSTSLRALRGHLARAVLPLGFVRASEARRIFRNRGLERVSLRSAAAASLAGLQLLPADLDLREAFVVDLGANEGDFSAAVLGLAPEARILAVEPGAGPRDRLERRLGSQPNVEISPVAVAGQTGTATFRVTAHDHNASLLQPRPESQDAIGGGWEVLREVEVPTVTLDDLVSERSIDVLKLDVQGAELEVIGGGQTTLARTRVVLLEMNLFSQYEGDATFDVLHSEMSSLGFDLVNVATPVTTANGTPPFIDGCYARRER